MDREEARKLVTAKLAEYLTRSYAELVAKIGDIDCSEVTGPSGTEYQIEIQAFWDDPIAKTVRVSVSIDDGGWRAFFPKVDSFILDPRGRFVGE